MSCPLNLHFRPTQAGMELRQTMAGSRRLLPCLLYSTNPAQHCQPYGGGGWRAATLCKLHNHAEGVPYSASTVALQTKQQHMSVPACRDVLWAQCSSSGTTGLPC